MNNITIKHEGVNYHLEQFLWAWKQDLEVDVNLYSFNHQVEMLSEVKRILKEHFRDTSWTQNDKRYNTLIGESVRDTPLTK